mgnify:CR=1 FL=1
MKKDDKKPEKKFHTRRAPSFKERAQKKAGKNTVDEIIENPTPEKEEKVYEESWFFASCPREVEYLLEEEIKKLMLKERFQEEHKGFDFSDAQINGNVPNAKDFMGGLKYN